MGRINQLTQKPTLVDADIFPVWDSESNRTRAVLASTILKYIDDNPTTDKFIQSGSYSAGTLTLTYNDGNSIAVSGFSTGGFEDMGVIGQSDDPKTKPTGAYYVTEQFIDAPSLSGSYVGMLIKQDDIDGSNGELITYYTDVGILHRYKLAGGWESWKEPPAQDNTTVASIPLKSSNGFADSSIKNYIPQGETDPIIDSSAPWYQGSVDDTKDTPIFIYRGNGLAPPSDDWGAVAIGVYEDGSYAIFDYFNKAGDSYGIYVDEKGISVRKNSGSITPLADSIRRIEIGQFATSSTQNPTGLGESGKARVNFGAGGNTSGNELTVASDGTITCNTSNIQYLIEITARIGRTGASGVSILHGRLMYSADGIESNATQVGSTSTTELDDADTIWRERFELTLEPASGSKFWVEFARDESGNNSGGILTQQPTGSLSGWNQSSSASIAFYRAGIS